MNTMINTKCNLACSYCFADETMAARGYTEDMTMENFIEVLEYHKKSGQTEVRLLGGEPTIHPLFGDFLDKILEYPEFEVIMIFSNGSFKDDIRNKLIETSKKIKVQMMVNFNHWLDTGRHKWNKTVETIEKLSEHGIISALGINLFNEQQEWQ